MLIKNETKLSNMDIGRLIDLVIASNNGDTHYYGKTEIGEVEYKNVKYGVQIRYLKRYTEWRIYEI